MEWEARATGETHWGRDRLATNKFLLFPLMMKMLDNLTTTKSVMASITMIPNPCDEIGERRRDAKFC